MTPAPRLADALARHGHMVHLAVPGNSVFQRCYPCSPKDADDAERDRRAARAFAINVELAAENRAIAEIERDRLMRDGRPEAAAEWAGWATFFADLQHVNQEMSHAA